MRIIYTAAVVVDPSQVDYLVNVCKMTVRQATHITLHFGDQDIPENLGETVYFIPETHYNDDSLTCVAGKLVGCETTNKVAHLTLSHEEHRKPFESNKLIQEGGFPLELDDAPAIKCRVGAYVVSDEGTAHWIFDK